MELKILDFKSNWCQPCKRLSPILDEIEKETGVYILKIDVDDNEEMVISYGIKSIPTLIFIKDDVVVDRISGTVSKDTILKKINELK